MIRKYPNAPAQSQEIHAIEHPSMTREGFDLNLLLQLGV